MENKQFDQEIRESHGLSQEQWDKLDNSQRQALKDAYFAKRQQEFLKK